MQNVPQTSIAQAGKVEFSKVNSRSTNDMSGDLFGAFMAYEMQTEQESFAPAPDLESFADATPNNPARAGAVAVAADTKTVENVPKVPPVVARTPAGQNQAEARPGKTQEQFAETRSAKPASTAKNTGTKHAEAKSSEVRDTEAQYVARNVKAKAVAADSAKAVKSGTSKDARLAEADGRTKAPKAQVTMDEMREVLVSLEDLEGMKEQLLQYGLTEDDVAQLVEQAKSTQGLTWGRMVAFLSKKMELLDRNLEITPEQKQQLMTFFQKLGISASDAEGMVAGMADGNLDKVLATLDRHIKSMDQEQLLDLDANELKAFMEELRKLKAESQARELGVVRTISQAMKKAVNRIRSQYAAENNQARADQAGAKGTGERPTVNTKVADAARLVDTKTAERAAGDAARNAERVIKVLEPVEQTRAAVDQVLDKAAEVVAKGGSDKPADHFLNDHFLNREPKGEQDAWSEFMDKMRQEPNLLGKAAKTVSADALTAKESMTEALGQARQNFNATLDKLDAPKVMRQVQDSVLKNLGQGRKQITLQLEPASLGRLSIVLSTTKGGEVQATIRADNHDSAKLIAENLDSIRQYMENQGVKVSRLEVQTQLSQFQGNEWYGEAGHNQAREQEVQARMMNRWRTLRNSNGDSAGVRAAAEAARQAVLGNTGLHVIA